MGSIARRGEKRKSGRSHDAESVPTVTERLRRDTPKLADCAAYADAVAAGSRADGRELHILYFLATHADESNEVEIGQETLSLLFHIEERSIGRILRKLKRLGELAQVRRGRWHRKSRYRITVPRDG